MPKLGWIILGHGIIRTGLGGLLRRIGRRLLFLYRTLI
jgi:hypothetical protein